MTVYGKVGCVWKVSELVVKLQQGSMLLAGLGKLVLTFAVIKLRSLIK